MFQNVKTKEMLPRIYSIVLQNMATVFLYQGVEYSLEDAAKNLLIAIKEILK